MGMINTQQAVIDQKSAQPMFGRRTNTAWRRDPNVPPFDLYSTVTWLL